jgi:hypothetical protein
MNAWEQFEGEIHAYFDCDLATDMSVFPQLIGHIADGYDLTTGSRYIEGVVCSKPFLRGTTSKASNAIIRLVFHNGIRYR